jgi:hypothetical protein
MKTCASRPERAHQFSAIGAVKEKLPTIRIHCDRDCGVPNSLAFGSAQQVINTPSSRSSARNFVTAEAISRPVRRQRLQDGARRFSGRCHRI